MGQDHQVYVGSLLSCRAKLIAEGNVLHNRGLAFVTYESEHAAAFAKEAMSNQSLDGDEILNVR